MASTWSCAQVAVQPRQLDAHLHAQLGVEVGERLVEEEDIRLAHDRASDRHALPLAARKGARMAVEYFGNLQDAGGAPHLVVDFFLPGAGDAQAKGHVLEHRHMRIERIGLEHHGDAAFGRAQRVNPLAADVDAAVLEGFEPGDHAQQCRLATSRWPDENGELLLFDREVNAVDDLHVAIALDDGLQCDIAHRWSRSILFRSAGPSLQSPQMRNYVRYAELHAIVLRSGRQRASSPRSLPRRDFHAAFRSRLPRLLPSFVPG